MPKQDSAEALALQALAWLATQEDLLAAFFGSTGLSVDELRNRATEPEFLGSVLDFLLTDDALIVAFCDATDLRYEAPMQARAALPGGEAVHWT